MIVDKWKLVDAVEWNWKWNN